jgi:hypothetical protein
MSQSMNLLFKTIINIEQAKYLNDYKIHFKFNDGKENIVDFRPFILSSSHPDIKKYKDKKIFKSFSLKYGEIEWNDYELAFPVFDLYQGYV